MLPLDCITISAPFCIVIDKTDIEVKERIIT